MDRRFFEDDEKDYENEDSRNFDEIEYEEEFENCECEYDDLEEDEEPGYRCEYKNDCSDEDEWYCDNKHSKVDEDLDPEENNCGFKIECYSTFEDEDSDNELKDSFSRGKKEGYKEGYKNGYDDGVKDAIKVAYKAGFKCGLKAARFRK